MPKIGTRGIAGAVALFWLLLPPLAAPALAAETAAETEPGHDELTAADGERLFANTCGFCHHKGGRKAGKGPKLAGSERSDAFLFKRIQTGKQGRMPAFGRTFSEREIRAIVAYIRSLEPDGN